MVRHPVIATASTERHFADILALQRRYRVGAWPGEVEAREGFVFAEHSLPVLRQMAEALPQAIALGGDEVVGYCLALAPELRGLVPALEPMFRQFERIEHRGRRMAEWRYFVGGQVCVDRPYRGQGLLARLYREVADRSPPGYRLCVTEVALRNAVSLRAHLRMGFEEIARYQADGEEWSVVAWEFRGARA